jgi:hypothetical protein
MAPPGGALAAGVLKAEHTVLCLAADTAAGVVGTATGAGAALAFLAGWKKDEIALLAGCATAEGAASAAALVAVAAADSWLMITAGPSAGVAACFGGLPRLRFGGAAAYAACGCGPGCLGGRPRLRLPAMGVTLPPGSLGRASAARAGWASGGGAAGCCAGRRFRGERLAVGKAGSGVSSLGGGRPAQAGMYCSICRTASPAPSLH